MLDGPREPVVFRHNETPPGTGVPGVSGGVGFPTEVGVIPAAQPHTRRVMLLTRFDDTILTPTAAIRLGLRLIHRGLTQAISR